MCNISNKFRNKKNVKELFASLKGIIQKQRVSDIDKNKIKGGT